MQKNWNTLKSASLAGHKPRPDMLFTWQGKDTSGTIRQGELRAASKQSADQQLTQQGILLPKIRRKTGKLQSRQKITEKDITFFTRQLTVLLKAGIPLLQAFDILAKSQAHDAASRLLLEIRQEVENGTSLHQAFARFPRYFDPLFCNLVATGEQAGMLEAMLERIAHYKEKTRALKAKIRLMLFYPSCIVTVAVLVLAVIMIWVIPAFKEVFTSFGATLPAPTLFVMALSDFFIHAGVWLLAGTSLALFVFFQAWKRWPALQYKTDRLLLALPVFKTILQQAVIARWSRTLGALFSAGVPLIDAFEPVGKACGNIIYTRATVAIQQAVNAGSTLTAAMQNTQVFPPLVTQMVAVGEESGSLDQMLENIAHFYEAQVDEAVASFSALLEPLIMVVLGVLIGGLIIALYLPIFKLGSVL